MDEPEDAQAGWLAEKKVNLPVQLNLTGTDLPDVPLVMDNA